MLTIHEPAVAAAVAAATNQTAQRAALIAPWTGGGLDVTVRSMNGATVRDITTYGTWQQDSNTPRGMTLGPILARTVSSTGTVTSVEYRAGATLVFSMPAAVAPATADLVFPAAGGGVVAGARTNLADPVVGKVTISADPALPVNAVFATALTLSVPNSGVNGSPATVTVTPNGPIPGAGLSVTLAASNGGVLGSTSLSFTAGATAAQSTTLTRAAAGASTVTMTNSGGLTNTGSPATYTSVAPGATVATLTLTSPTTASAPFCVAQAFKQGDIPAGSGIVVTGATAQAVIKNAWPDGSAKIALISGTANLTANTPATVSFGAGAASTGTALTTADLKAALTQPVTVDAGAFGSASWSGTDWDTPFQTWVAGHRMSSWVYRKPVGGDAHLVAWLEVRLFAGGAVEVLPWVENAYLTVASPTNKSATYSFTMGGSSRFSAALDIKHHTRVPLIASGIGAHWLGTDPQVTPTHNVAYLMESKLVPNYATGLDAGAYAFTESYTPNWIGDTSASMGNAGYSAHIGVLPQWAAVYLAGGADARAYRYVIANGLAAGSWSIHYRNESTNDVPTFAEFPSIGLLSGGTPSLPAETGGVNQKAGVNAVPDTDHQPSLAYLPYLLTGRPFFLEEHLFWTFWNYARTNQQTREGASSIEFSGTGRSRGWNLRTKAQALAIVPPAHSSFVNLKAAWEANVAAYRGRYVDGTRDSGVWQNSLGCTALYGGGGTSPYGTDGTYWWDAPWMQATIAMAFGHGWDVGLPQSAPSLANHAAVRDFAYKQFVDRAGNGAGGTWNYRHFSAFAVAYSSPSTAAPGTFLPDWGASYALFKLHNAATGSFAPLAALPAGNAMYYGDVLVDGAAFASSTATCFNLAALAFAVEHGVAGAAAGWLRIMGSSSFVGASTAYRSNPNWAIKPRVDPALPAFVPVEGRFADMGASTLNSVTPSTWPKNNDASPFTNWVSAAWCPGFGTRGGLSITGGGHLGPDSNAGGGVWVFDIGQQAWVGRCTPGASLWEPPLGGSAAYYNDYCESIRAENLGHVYPAHTYQGLLYQSPANGGGSQGSLVRVCNGATSFVGRTGINNKTVHTYDLSSATAAPVRRINDLFPSRPLGTYVAAVLDEAAGGFWAMQYDGSSGLVFVRFSDWSVTAYPAVAFTIYGSANLVYIPSRSCLVSIGETGSYPALSVQIRVCPIVAGVPQGWTTVTPSGTVPVETIGSGVTRARFGGDWSTILNCIVCWPGPNPDSITPAYTIYKLTPPPGLITGSGWAWTSETLTAQGGEAPPHDVNIYNGSFYQNGTWSRFREAPSIKCFVNINSLNMPAQAWRLTGMV